jgi:hypothetical protein
MGLALGLLLAASIDGQAALRHASALAALGPHPWGSPRNAAAAQYVAAELRRTGLTEVDLQGFAQDGLRGTNVIATLRAPSEEMLVLCAHHDTTPETPGAYDGGGGVGLLIELARVMVREPTRTRTMVFASFDGEEARVTGQARPAGSRAWIERLGPGSRRIVAVLDVQMAGWAEGTPVLHPVAYPDPRRAGRPTVAPGWLVATVLDGARQRAAPFGVGAPWLGWISQPTVRTFRARLHGDDLSFLQAGLPAVMVSDSSLAALYPHRHRPADTADKLDAGALERMGEGLLGATRALDSRARGPSEDPDWYAVFGRVVGSSTLLALAAVSVLPGLRVGLAGGGPVLIARALQAVLFGLLFWLHPVPALWLLLLPNVLLPLGRARWATVVALTPALALVGFGVAGWLRGILTGLWLGPWEIIVTILAFALAFIRPARGRKKKRRR